MSAFGEVARLITYTPEKPRGGGLNGKPPSQPAAQRGGTVPPACHWFCKFRDPQSTYAATARGEVSIGAVRALIRPARSRDGANTLSAPRGRAGHGHVATQPEGGYYAGGGTNWHRSGGGRPIDLQPPPHMAAAAGPPADYLMGQASRVPTAEQARAADGARADGVIKDPRAESPAPPAVGGSEPRGLAREGQVADSRVEPVVELVVAAYKRLGIDPTDDADTSAAHEAAPPADVALADPLGIALEARQSVKVAA